MYAQILQGGTTNCLGRMKLSPELSTHGLPRRVYYVSNIGKHGRNMKLCISNQLNEIFPANEEQRKERRPLIKMCGIASIKDAALVAESGADFIGMILWPNSKRSVTSLHVAKGISKIVQENGAKSVGVFVDDDADTILRFSDAVNLDFVQLHGNGSRSAFPTLRSQKQVIFVLHANEDGELLNTISEEESSMVEDGELLNTISEEESSMVDWILVDSAKGGSGKGFNWSRFKLPRLTSKHGWLLGGGLHPQNVAKAYNTLRPHGVDVSSGICAEDGIQKDRSKIASFINTVQSLHYC